MFKACSTIFRDGDCAPPLMTSTRPGKPPAQHERTLQRKGPSKPFFGLCSFFSVCLGHSHCIRQRQCSQRQAQTSLSCVPPSLQCPSSPPLATPSHCNPTSNLLSSASLPSSPCVLRLSPFLFRPFSLAPSPTSRPPPTRCVLVDPGAS